MVKALILSDEVMKNFHNFRTLHEEKCDTPTSISFTFLEHGQIIIAECMGCGNILDLTEL